MKKLIVAILCLCMPGIAHHSMAGFDRSQNLSMEGVVKNFAWQNPHAWIELEVTKDGKTVTWNFEMTAPAYLVRANRLLSSRLVELGRKYPIHLMAKAGDWGLPPSKGVDEDTFTADSVELSRSRLMAL